MFSRPTPESSGAGELRTVASNNSMHSFNDELPKPPWNPADLSINCGASVSSFLTGSSVASCYSVESKSSSNPSASLVPTLVIPIKAS